MAAHQAPLSLRFSRQEHWSGLAFPSPMRESEVAQSCPTLSGPMDCSPPGSSAHGILQAGALEWGAIAFSVCSPALLQTPLHFTFVCVLAPQLCPTPCDLMDCNLPGFSVHGILQARILEWTAIPFTFFFYFKNQPRRRPAYRSVCVLSLSQMLNFG